MTAKTEKEAFVLEYLKSKALGDLAGTAGTYDELFTDAWHQKFPHHKMVVYTIGPNSIAVANKTLRSMWKEGKLLRQTLGNQLAKQYCQPTYSFIYRLPEYGIGETWASFCHRTDRDKCGRKRIRFGRRV